MNKLTAIGLVALSTAALTSGCAYGITDDDYAGYDEPSLEVEAPGSPERARGPAGEFAEFPASEGVRPVVPELDPPAEEFVPQGVCGDSVIDAGEQCDDGNRMDEDGCSATCAVEHGNYCGGEPSVCISVCGDGVVALSEPCDDANNEDEDGCSAKCEVENGYECGSEPSICGPKCGDGIIAGFEECDDRNGKNKDGCSSDCTVEEGYYCDSQPSECELVCETGSSDDC